jgi:hypothetical protein
LHGNIGKYGEGERCCFRTRLPDHWRAVGAKHWGFGGRLLECYGATLDIFDIQHDDMTVTLVADRLACAAGKEVRTLAAGSS